MPNQSFAKVHLNFIDGLRGVATLMVLALHWYDMGVGQITDTWYWAGAGKLIESGRLGVPLFFMVSAFTLFASCVLRFHRERFPVANFYVRRAFRILPLWWLCLFLYAGRDFHKLFAHPCCLFFYFGFDLGGDHLLFPGWSLVVEETFYLMLPFLFPLLKNFRRVAAFAAAMMGLRLLWQFGLLDAVFPRSVSQPGFFVLSHWYCFGLGFLLYFAYDRGWFPKSRRAVALLDAAVFLVVPVTVYLAHPWGRYDFLASLAFGLVFIAAFSPQSITAKVLAWPLLRRFGVSCYSIYLLNPYLINVLHARTPLVAFLNRLSPSAEVRFLVSFPFLAALMLLVGTISFRTFETLFIRAGKLTIRLYENGIAALRIRYT